MRKPNAFRTYSLSSFALSKSIDAGENEMPDIIDAVKVYATIGEIMAIFEEHGAYQETIVTA